MTEITEQVKKINELLEHLNNIIHGPPALIKKNDVYIPNLNKILTDAVFRPPRTYNEGMVIDNIFITVEYNNELYHPNNSFIPFTTTQEFDRDKWSLIVRDKSFPIRDRHSLDTLASYPNGTVASIQGLFYKKQEGYTGISSAGREFNIDHIKPLDDLNISPGHFSEYSTSISNCQMGINYAIEYANSDKVCGGTVVLKNDAPYHINGPIKMLDGVTLTGGSEIYSNKSRLATLVINSELEPTVLGNKNNVLAGMILDGVEGINIKGIEIDMENAPDKTIGIIIAGYNYLDMENINIFNTNNNQKPILFVMKDNLSLLYGNIKNLILFAKRDYKGIMCDIEHKKLYGGTATKDKRIGYTTFDNLRTLYGGTSIRLIKPGRSMKFNNLQMRKGNDTNKAFICEDPLNEKPQICGGRVNNFKYGFPSNKVIVKDYFFKKRTEPYYDEDENNKPDFSIDNDQSQYRIINNSGTVIHETSSVLHNKIIKADRNDFSQVDNKLILLSSKNFDKRSVHYICNLDIDIPDYEYGVKGFLFQVYMRGKEVLLRSNIGYGSLSDDFGSANIDIDIDIKSKYDNSVGNYKNLLLSNRSVIDIRATFTVTGSVKTYEMNFDNKYDSLIPEISNPYESLYSIGDDIISPVIF